MNENRPPEEAVLEVLEGAKKKLAGMAELELQRITKEIELLEKKLKEKALTSLVREGRIFLAKVLKDGRITIPIEWRELLDIEEGDIVKVEILDVYKAKEL